MAKGSHYIQAIDLLLDAELQNQQAKRDNKVAAAIGQLVAPFDIDPRSRRLAGAFKSIKTSSHEDNKKELRLVFRERFPQLKMLSDVELTMFIDELAFHMSKLDAELYKERTKLSTISTIIRPLSTKWLERWRLQRNDGFNYDQALVRVDALMNKEVSGIDQFQLWAEEVFDLFTELVIFRASPLDKLTSARRPSGMVSEGNERIYRKNWTDFKNQFGTELVRRTEDIADGRADLAFNAAYRPQFRQMDYGFTQSPGYEKTERFGQYAPTSSPAMASIPSESAPLGNSGSFPLYKVILESSVKGNGEATHTWTSKDLLTKEIEKVFNTIARTWGEFGETLNVTFVYDNAGAESSIQVPNKTPTDAAQAVIDLIDLAD
jgi:hypothetical protein